MQTIVPKLPKKAPKADIDLNEARAWAARARITFALKGGQLGFSDPHERMVDWLRDAVAAHKGDLVDLLKLQAKFTWLHDQIRRLRYEEALPGMTRAASLDYVEERITRLGAECFRRSGSYNGYVDPNDWGAEEAVCDLRISFAEMADRDRGYPIPATSGIPRLASGIRDDCTWQQARETAPK